MESNFQAKINQKLLNSKVFNFEHQGLYRNTKKMNRLKSSGSAKARTMMNLHNNEAGRRVSKMQFFTHYSLSQFVPFRDEEEKCYNNSLT